MSYDPPYPSCTLHCYSLSQLSWGEAGVTPCTGHQFITGPPTEQLFALTLTSDESTFTVGLRSSTEATQTHREHVKLGTERPPGLGISLLSAPQLSKPLWTLHHKSGGDKPHDVRLNYQIPDLLGLNSGCLLAPRRSLFANVRSTSDSLSNTVLITQRCKNTPALVLQFAPLLFVTGTVLAKYNLWQQM